MLFLRNVANLLLADGQKDNESEINQEMDKLFIKPAGSASWAMTSSKSTNLREDELCQVRKEPQVIIVASTSFPEPSEGWIWLEIQFTW